MYNVNLLNGLFCDIGLLAFMILYVIWHNYDIICCVRTKVSHFCLNRWGETFYIVDFSSHKTYRDSVYNYLTGTSSAGYQSGSSTTELTPEQLREKRLKRSQCVRVLVHCTTFTCTTAPSVLLSIPTLTDKVMAEERRLIYSLMEIYKTVNSGSAAQTVWLWW